MSATPATDSESEADPFRLILSTAVSALTMQSGFETAEPLVLETLTEMLGSYIGEIGHYSKNLAELCGRNEIIPADVSLTLTQMGCRLDSLVNSLGRETNRIVIPPPSSPTKTTPDSIIFHVGKSRPKPAHIPSHFPPLPDPHTYIKTMTEIHPPEDYETSREIAAMEQRKIEFSLVQFRCNVEPTHSFRAGNEQFQLLMPRRVPHPYLEALLPPAIANLEDSSASENVEESEENVPRQPAPTPGGDNSFLRQPKLPKSHGVF